MRHTRVVLVAVVFVGCKAYDPLYCDANTPCTDPDRPFCDIAGDYPASEGVARTCIPEPAQGGDDDDGSQDDGGDDGAVGEPCAETSCTDGVLEVCGPDGTVESSDECALGCFDGERCSALVPSNGLTTALDESILEPAVDLPDGATIDTDTGAIRSAQGDSIAVLSVTVPQPDGPAIRVFMASAWTIHDVKIRGSLPVAFVTTGEIEIHGVLDASADGSTPGPGGRDCVAEGNGGSPTGGFWQRRGAPVYPDWHWVWCGSGGGGFGSAGGPGGMQVSGEPGLGGAPNGGPTLVPMLGGCRGGGSDSAHRGAGGGALQLVSATRIRVLDDGAIHVGGGGGRGAGLGIDDPAKEPAQPSSGGGGSGGAILLEAPIVAMRPSSALLAAGGGGGGAGSCGARDGADALPDGDTVPRGGSCPFEEEVSPNGYQPPAGGDGASGASAGRGEDEGFSAGSGGGGHGRIRINTEFGTYDGSEDAEIRGTVTTGSVGRR